LQFLTKVPPKVALDLAASIVTYSIKYGVELPQSVTPFFGRAEGYNDEAEIEFDFNRGDVEAVDEIKSMLSDRWIPRDNDNR